MDMNEKLQTIRDFIKEEIKSLEGLLHPIESILSEVRLIFKVQLIFY